MINATLPKMPQRFPSVPQHILRNRLRNQGGNAPLRRPVLQSPPATRSTRRQFLSLLGLCIRKIPRLPDILSEIIEFLILAAAPAFEKPDQLPVTAGHTGTRRTTLISIQRFTPYRGVSIDSIWNRLRDAVIPLLPIKIYGEELQTLYSNFRRNTILKARVRGDIDLAKVTKNVNEAIRSFGIEPHYTFVPSLVTVLENIRFTDANLNVAKSDWPQPLFSIDTLVFFRLLVPKRAEELRRVALL
jgi:hypothetical protein